MQFRDQPIRQKLMTMILVTSGAVLLLTAAAFIGYEWLTFRRTSVQQLATLGEIIAAQSTGAVAFDNQHDATEILAALRAERHIVAASLYDKQGHLFSYYPSDAREDRFPSIPQGDGFRFVGGHLVGFTAVVQVKGSQRFGTLYLESDMEAMYERLRLYAVIALCVVLICSLVAYALSRVLQGQISNPILTLAETAKAVSERHDYSVRASRHGADELGVLTDAFNHMLAQIQEQNDVLEKRVRERTAELELSNNELEAFCSSAAHDLRTPLRTITGFAEILLDPRATISAEKTQHYIQLIRDGSGQMSHLINDLLAFSKFSRQALSVKSIDLEQLCRAIYQDLESETRGRNIRLEIQPLPSTKGDPALVRVALTNLLSNAIKYTRPRSEAIIEVGALPAEAAKSPIYFVRDNGVGFDMQDAGKLFGVFQRLHLAHEFEGTGVGLATVRRIIDRHGGRVWAEAAPDAGATFFFTLAS